MEKPKFCPAVWLSGFFALGAVVHLLRSMGGVSLVIEGHEIPMAVSVAAFIILGALSIGALAVGLKKPCCHSKHHEKCDPEAG